MILVSEAFLFLANSVVVFDGLFLFLFSFCPFTWAAKQRLICSFSLNNAKHKTWRLSYFFPFLSFESPWNNLLYLSNWYLVNSPLFFNSFAIVYILIFLFCLSKQKENQNIFLLNFFLFSALDIRFAEIPFQIPEIVFILRGFGSILIWNWQREPNMHVCFPFDKVYSFAFGKFLLVWFSRVNEQINENSYFSLCFFFRSRHRRFRITSHKHRIKNEKSNARENHETMISLAII